jgi:hypothetical protein
MILTIITLTFFFILFKSYVERYDNFRHTLVNDKHTAEAITPNDIFYLAIFCWILDILLVYFLYKSWGLFICIIYITITNLIPKFLSFVFPLPTYKSFLKKAKKSLLKNVKEEHLNHPQITELLNKIESDS